MGDLGASCFCEDNIETASGLTVSLFLLEMITLVAPLFCDTGEAGFSEACFIAIDLEVTITLPLSSFFGEEMSSFFGEEMSSFFREEMSFFFKFGEAETELEISFHFQLDPQF